MCSYIQKEIVKATVGIEGSRLYGDGKSALVLEGGGMRGTFSSGVMDAFMESGIRFPFVIGVSAGACNGASYVSWQPGRAHFSNIDMMEKYQYVSLRNLIKQGNIFDPDLLYNRLPNELYPFDYETYFNGPTKYECVTTNCLTGKAEYLSEHKDKKKALDIILASSSLPYVSKIVNIDGIPMLDGGIADSIPVDRAISLGYENNVVVLTRNKGYRKEIRRHWLPSFIYRKYPNLRHALLCRSITYNRQLQHIEDLEEKGKIRVIRPIIPIEVGRIERDANKLQALYEEGLKLGREFCKNL